MNRDETDQISGGGLDGPDVRDAGGLRTAALIAVAIGAVVSLVLMFRVGQSNPSIVLMAMFTIWVVSPFVGLAVSTTVLKRWLVINQTLLTVFMLIIPTVSLVFYMDVVLRPRPQPAFMFLAVPFGSWLAIVTVVVAAIISRRLSAH